MIRVTRETRIQMLLTSYEDALAGLDENGQDGRGSPESRLLQEKALWRAGSYADLDKALKDLSSGLLKALYVAYIAQSPRRHIEQRLRLWNTPLAKTALRNLDLAMPKRIVVPAAIRGNWQDYVSSGKRKLRKDGWVYFIQAGRDGPVKIGSSDNPWGRIGDLQTSNAVSLKLLAIYPGIKNETVFHNRFEDYRLRGEWFTMNDEIRKFIQEECFDPDEYPHKRLSEMVRSV